MYDLDLRTLTALLVSTAKRDTSVHPTWTTNILLGTFEQLLIREKNDMTGFAEVARAAMPVIDDPAITALLKLAQINGLRRMTEKQAEIDDCKRLFAEVRSEIDSLAEGANKSRCHSFLLYQESVFMARNGFYTEAATTAQETADNETDAVKKEINRHLATVYKTWAAIVAGKDDPEELARGMRESLLSLGTAVAGTSEEIGWGHGNGPANMLTTMLLTDTSWWQTWRDVLNDMHRYSDQLAAATKMQIEVFGIEDLRREGQLARALEDLQGLLDREDLTQECRALALLMQARIFRDDNAFARARGIYELIVPGPDMHMIAAVAAREAAALPQDAA